MREDSSAYERTAPNLRSNLVNTTAEMAIAPRMLQTALPGPPAAGSSAPGTFSTAMDARACPLATAYVYLPSSAEATSFQPLLPFSTSTTVPADTLM